MAKGGLRGTGARLDGGYDGTTVVPHDTNLLTDGTTRAVYVGTPGDIKVTMAGGTALVFKNASGMLDLQVKIIWSAGTTATDIVAIY